MTTWASMRALLEAIPDLDGAKCKGRSDLYERTVAEHRITGRLTKTELDQARSAALATCTACPALQPCRAWLGALRPTQRPRGIIAGTLVQSDGHIT